MSGSLNKVLLIGRMGRDPELKHMPSGGAVLEISMATDHKPKEGDQKTTWHKVILFDRQAETLAKHGTKGTQLYIEGRIRMRKYEHKGEDRVAFEIVADRFQFIGGKEIPEDPPARSERQESTPGRRSRGFEEAPKDPVATAKEAAKRNTRQSAFDDLEDDIPF